MSVSNPGLPDQGHLFLVAVWAWMRANPTCAFEAFEHAVNRIFEQMDKETPR